MATKTKAPKATKTKPDAKRTKAVAAAQAADAAANATKPGKKTKTTTIDAGGGILIDVVETAKPTKAKKAPKEPKAKKVSGLDAAAQVLKAKGEPMTCKAIIDEVLAKGLWKTNGKTPAATLYSAMLREIDAKPGESRFAKTGRGLFTATKN